MSNEPESSAQAAAASRSRSRKRRRRQASYSVSSSSDEDASSDNEAANADETMDVDGASSASSSVSSSGSGSSPTGSKIDSTSGSESDSDDSSDDADEAGDSEAAAAGSALVPTKKERPRYPTLSPSPPPTSLPSFLPLRPTAAEGNAPKEGEEEDRRTRFRRVYMEKLVEGFGSDLDKLRTEDASLGQSKLQILVDALTSGIDIFNDPYYVKLGQSTPKDAVDEVGIVLGDL